MVALLDKEDLDVLKNNEEMDIAIKEEPKYMRVNSIKSWRVPREVF